MTDDEIDAIACAITARANAFIESGDTGEFDWVFEFARAIAAAEREACALECARRSLEWEGEAHSEKGCFECGVEDGLSIAAAAIRSRTTESESDAR